MFANGTQPEVMRARGITNRTDPQSFGAQLPSTTTAQGCVAGA